MAGVKRRRNDDRPAIWVGYGKLLKLLRERAKLTQQGLAEVLGYSVELVASIEQGRRPAQEAFTEAAESALGADGVLITLQEDVDLARLPMFFRDFALLEAEAACRYSYDPLLVPGLLQTEDYARALLSVNFPPLDEAIVEERVAARLARQALLTRQSPPIVFVFIIEESVLYRQIGSREIHVAQLRKLLECARMRNVEVQVMPSSRGAHSGLNGMMVLLETKDRQQYVCIETQDVVAIRSDRDEVSDFYMRYGMLRTQALDSDESVRLIERVIGEL